LERIFNAYGILPFYLLLIELEAEEAFEECIVLRDFISAKKYPTKTEEASKIIILQSRRLGKTFLTFEYMKGTPRFVKELRREIKKHLVS
jgi:hypothetical protein